RAQRLCRQQAVDLGPAAGFGAVRHSELPVDVREVELHGLLCHPEHPCELRVRHPFRDELEDLDLATRQLRVVDGRLYWDRLRTVDLAGEVDRVLVYLAHGDGQVVGVRLLDDVRDRAQ